MIEMINASTCFIAFGIWKPVTVLPRLVIPVRGDTGQESSLEFIVISTTHQTNICSSESVSIETNCLHRTQGTREATNCGLLEWHKSYVKSISVRK